MFSGFGGPSLKELTELWKSQEFVYETHTGQPPPPKRQSHHSHHRHQTQEQAQAHGNVLDASPSTPRGWTVVVARTGVPLQLATGQHLSDELQVALARHPQQRPRHRPISAHVIQCATLRAGLDEEFG